MVELGQTRPQGHRVEVRVGAVGLSSARSLLGETEGGGPCVRKHHLIRHDQIAQS